MVAAVPQHNIAGVAIKVCAAISWAGSRVRKPRETHPTGMANLNPLKYCFRCRRSKPRATFRTLPGDPSRRQLCAECHQQLMATRSRATRDRDSEDVEKAVYDGMRDLRR
jgi:hypothetical protein